MKLTGENAKQMEEGISLVLSRWRELSDAVTNLWGGPHSAQKANNLVDSVIGFFCQPNRRESPSIDDLEDLLIDGMDSLSVTADDSVKEVACILMNMYEECLENNYQRIQNLRDTARFFDKGRPALPPRAKKVARGSDGIIEDTQVSSTIDANSSVPESASRTLVSDDHALPYQEHEGDSEAMQVDGEAPWITVAAKRKSKSRKSN